MVLNVLRDIWGCTRGVDRSAARHRGIGSVESGGVVAATLVLPERARAVTAPPGGGTSRTCRPGERCGSSPPS